MKSALVIVSLLLGAASVASAAPTPHELGAVVDPGGKLLAGNAAQVTYNAELGGTYYVSFRRAVVGCVATATVSGGGSTPIDPPAVLTVGPARGAPQAIAVQIRDLTGKLVRRGFNLSVRCF